jgi:tRNA threonylcarbamoyladenosine biosynthesis protein TsaB
LQDLQAIAFGSGPGAFTGLRTACAVAQGLGLGLGVPVLPVDSLLLVAEDARLQWLGQQGAAAAGPLTVDVVMDARMNEVYAGRYRWAPLPAGPASAPAPAGPWHVLQAPQLCSLAGWSGWAAEPAVDVVAGSALQAFADRMALPPHLLRLPAEENRAAALLRLALRGWAAGQAVDPAQAVPLYGRDKVAQTTLEREQSRAATAALAAAATGPAGATAQPPAATPARAPKPGARP